MSYDISLTEPETGTTIQFDEPHDIRGGTYVVGGTSEAWLNVTYNYSQHYRRIGASGIRTIYGMTGKDSIPLLEQAIASLGDDVSSDYWAATEGNAKQALVGLLSFAKRRPDGIWKGD